MLDWWDEFRIEIVDHRKYSRHVTIPAALCSPRKIRECIGKALQVGRFKLFGQDGSTVEGYDRCRFYFECLRSDFMLATEKQLVFRLTPDERPLLDQSTPRIMPLIQRSRSPQFRAERALVQSCFIYVSNKEIAGRRGYRIIYPNRQRVRKDWSMKLSRSQKRRLEAVVDWCEFRIAYHPTKRWKPFVRRLSTRRDGSKHRHRKLKKETKPVKRCTPPGPIDTRNAFGWPFHMIIPASPTILIRVIITTPLAVYRSTHQMDYHRRRNHHLWQR